MPGTRVGRLTEIRHTETFLGDVYILYLDSDDGDMSADIGQNPLNYTLKCMHFIIWKLNLSKADLNKNNSLGKNTNTNGCLGRDGMF